MALDEDFKNLKHHCFLGHNNDKTGQATSDIGCTGGGRLSLKDTLECSASNHICYGTNGDNRHV